MRVVQVFVGGVYAANYKSGVAWHEVRVMYVCMYACM